MNKETLKRVIEVAAGREKADVVLKNCNIIDVFSGTIAVGDIAFCGDVIAGTGHYHGITEYDGTGKFASPGLIDSHIHIESSYLSPEEYAFARE